MMNKNYESCKNKDEVYNEDIRIFYLIASRIKKTLLTDKFF